MRLRVAAIPALALCLASVPNLASAGWEYPYNHPTRSPVDAAPAAAKAGPALVDLDKEAATPHPVKTATAEDAVEDTGAPVEETSTLAKALDESLPEEGQTEALADLDRKVVEVGRGDTLLGLLVNAAVPKIDAHDAIEALRSVFDPRRLQVGQEIALLFQQEAGSDRRFMGLELEPDAERAVSVARDRRRRVRGRNGR